MAQTITRDELKASIDAGEVTVVETLRAEHFEQGHLPGAIHIHFEEVAERAPVLLPDKHARIVTYCSNTACCNSEAAANQLTAMGYVDVRKYAEGKDDWQQAGLPIETEAPRAAERHEGGGRPSLRRAGRAGDHRHAHARPGRPAGPGARGGVDGQRRRPLDPLRPDVGSGTAGRRPGDRPGLGAPAPASVSLEAAATLPLNALTADGALDLTGLRRGQTLLVTGAAGGVGSFALELARASWVAHGRACCGRRRDAGAGSRCRRVRRPRGSPGKAVRRLVPGGVDAVIDAAVLGIAAHDALRGGGTFVALVRPFAPPPTRGTRVVVEEVWADGARLAELSALVDARQLTLRVAETTALAEAATAHARVEAGGLRGRVVLVA